MQRHHNKSINLCSSERQDQQSSYNKEGFPQTGFLPLLQLTHTPRPQTTIRIRSRFADVSRFPSLIYRKGGTKTTKQRILENQEKHRNNQGWRGPVWTATIGTCQLEHNWKASSLANIVQYHGDIDERTCPHGVAAAKM